MTLEQIYSLTLEQSMSILLERLTHLESEPSQEQIEAEFEVYKAELIAAEEARLAEEARVQDLKDRFAAFSDIGLLQGATGISNIHAYFRDSILGAEAEEAEAAMLALESAYELAQAELNKDAWLRSRQIEYAKLDTMLLEGLAENAAGRPEKLQEYLALREQIRLQYPKPE